MSTERARLLTQSDLAHGVHGWRICAWNELTVKLEDPGFPCVFSRNAFRKGLLKVVFVDRLDVDGIDDLATALRSFVRLSRSWDGTLKTSYPLVVFFDTALTGDLTRVEYVRFGWDVLQRLHEVDPARWPDSVPSRPSEANWSMCFDGMPLFVNMSTPQHELRRSRNIGSAFAFVINPRERFDRFAGDTAQGRRARSLIRERVDRYDQVAHSSDLGSYGDGALEWRQYELPDHDSEGHEPCPFECSQSAPETRSRVSGTATKGAVRP